MFSTVPNPAPHPGAQLGRRQDTCSTVLYIVFWWQSTTLFDHVSTRTLKGDIMTLYIEYVFDVETLCIDIFSRQKDQGPIPDSLKFGLPLKDCQHNGCAYDPPDIIASEDEL